MKRFICAVSAVFVCCFAFAAVRLSEMGFIEDIAGVAGKRAYAGDGGDAQYARFANPMGLAIDRWNNIYIADTRNHRVRRINVRTGEIETIAGTGKAGFANDGGNAVAKDQLSLAGKGRARVIRDAAEPDGQLFQLAKAARYFGQTVQPLPDGVGRLLGKGRKGQMPHDRLLQRSAARAGWGKRRGLAAHDSP